MQQYNNIVRRILKDGNWKEGRNGRTLSVFNVNYEHRLRSGFPVLTSKRVNWKAAIYELIWYLSGSRMTEKLRQYTKVWDPWAKGPYGIVPSAYGSRWRYFPENAQLVDYDYFRPQYIDQLQNAIDAIHKDPNTRRAVVIAWNPDEDWESALPPCHFAFVFNTQGDELNLHLSQRSCDVAVGLPFNMIAYAALLTMVAQLVGLKPGTFAHSIVDAHIYEPHIEAIQQQIERPLRELPSMRIATKASIDDYTYEGVEADFQLVGYEPHDAIKYEVIP